MAYYERNLPHWHPSGKAIFLTWRLHGSLPRSFLRSLKDDPRSTAGQKFRKIEARLDRAEDGPLWLKDARVAACVTNAIGEGAEGLGFYHLHAFVVMANHIHLLFDPVVPLQRITNGLKAVSARNANRILDRVGERFWQDESFDHWVRNGREFERIQSYIHRNPVAAGLVARPEDWPWSSAAKRTSVT
jgi:putative transposase